MSRSAISWNVPQTEHVVIEKQRSSAKAAEMRDEKSAGR